MPNGPTVAAGDSQRHKRETLRVVAVQCTVGIVVAGATFAVSGGTRGLSALAGVMCGVIPSYYFAVRLFRSRPSASAERALRSIYLGEMLKILLTAALFVVAVVALNAEFLPLIIGYGGTVIGSWLALLLPAATNGNTTIKR
ncbi:MAG: F0F1 ATP synthase subunit I [Gammaproteobacteria bacterium]|nr:F0F1 ATP synthase subunit I [Gammaproteobacteria bacterium]